MKGKEPKYRERLQDRILMDFEGRQRKKEKYLKKFKKNGRNEVQRIRF